MRTKTVELPCLSIFTVSCMFCLRVCAYVCLCMCAQVFVTVRAMGLISTAQCKYF